MILDSSAVVSILTKEQGHRAVHSALDGAESLAIGTPTLVETGLVVLVRSGIAGRSVLMGFLDDYDVQELAFEERHWREALNAFLRFGKGRHRAALNLGDCMTYATARLAGEPLLCLGDDFALTDLELVL